MKGDKKLCRNYTGIFVTNSVIKIFWKILRNRLEDENKRIKEQSGFSGDRSSINHIFVLRHIQKKQRDKGRTTEFVDLQKGYDNVLKFTLKNSKYEWKYYQYH